MKCLHQLIQEQAQKTPDALAVVGPSRSLTYAELDLESDQLAAHLRRAGIETDDTVGLFMEKSTDYLVGCIAALKAGGAFLPLFLDYPELLLVKIMEQTATKVVLTSADLLERFPAPGLTQLLAMDTDASWRGQKLERVEHDPEQLMFVVYTSGTTGEPKGIQLPHRAAVHSYLERTKIGAYKPGQRVGCNIFFVWECFRPLVHGATIHVIGDRTIYDPALLAEFLESHRITEVLFTPSLLDTMLAQWPRQQWQKFTSLEVLWLNGEVVTERLRAEALAALPEKVRLLNTYSISECHDVASMDLRSAELSSTEFSPVGYPIEGITVRIEDHELLVGGPGLARGYLGKPHLTAERFVELDGERYYRTGDLASQYPDGLLEIRGRCDSMVKIRGYSVQLGAVETALEGLPEVKAAAARAAGLEGQEKTLVAYVVPNAGAELGVDNGTCTLLRSQLEEMLPDFMIPRLFVTLDQLPLSPTTGKLDVKALPAPPVRTSRSVDDLKLSADSDPLKLVALLFERLLGLEENLVTAESNFFHLGGHSLMAVRCVRHLERIFSKTVSVRELYDHPTPKRLISLLTHGASESTSERPAPCEWTLDSDIAPPANMSAKTLCQAKAVFVTGGTGFLAAFLIDRLQKSTEAPIYCLVRPKGGSPQARLDDNLRSYGLSPSAQVRALAGDISKPQLGMAADDYQLLCDQVDLIFHCAALVNYVHSYRVLKPHTVDGTRHILRLACQGEGKSLHYISTNGVFPGGGTYLENREIDPYLADLSGGYGLAKWVAEKLVWEAHDRGLPVVQYRPGNIGHHTVTGSANPNDFQLLMLRGCEKMNQAPDVNHWFFEMTPVDFLTNAMVVFASSTRHFGQIYNVVQQPTNPARPFFDQLVSEAVFGGFLPLAEWLAELREVAEREGEGSLEVLADSLPDVEGYLSDTSVYDGTRFAEALAAEGVVVPAAGHDYLRMLLAKPVLV